MPLVEPQAFVQSQVALVFGDLFTTSTTPVSLMSKTITSVGGILCIWFTASASTTTTGETMLFGLYIDGVLKAGATARTAAANVAECVAITYRFFPGAGDHTVEIRWSIPTTGTMNIRAGSFSATEHGYMLIQEILV